MLCFLPCFPDWLGLSAPVVGFFFDGFALESEFADEFAFCAFVFVLEPEPDFVSFPLFEAGLFEVVELLADAD